MCMSFVAVGRSLTIVSYVAFKMDALWFWTMFNCNPPIAHCHPLLWGGGILVDHWSTISRFFCRRKTSYLSIKQKCCARKVNFLWCASHFPSVSSLCFYCFCRRKTSGYLSLKCCARKTNFLWCASHFQGSVSTRMLATWPVWTWRQRRRKATSICSSRDVCPDWRAQIENCHRSVTGCYIITVTWYCLKGFSQWQYNFLKI